MTKSSAVTPMPMIEHSHSFTTVGAAPGALACDSVTPSISHFVTG